MRDKSGEVKRQDVIGHSLKYYDWRQGESAAGMNMSNESVSI